MKWFLCMGTSNILFQLSFHNEPTSNISHLLFFHLPAVCLRPSESWPSHLSVYWQAAWSFSKHAESWLLFPKFQTDICIQQVLVGTNILYFPEIPRYCCRNAEGMQVLLVCRIQRPWYSLPAILFVSFLWGKFTLYYLLWAFKSMDAILNIKYNQVIWTAMVYMINYHPICMSLRDINKSPKYLYTW